jgi:uncharacterized protein YbaR (Trm112 family)
LTLTSKEDNVVSQELLEILRCPSCVREDRPNPGLLIHEGNWLICRDCDRKYPIRDDIPVMLIEEGDRFRDVPREELPAEPPPEEPLPVLSLPEVAEDRRRVILALIGAGLGVGLLVLLVMWLLRERETSD